MYRVMVVEDEKIIRNGIANVIERFENGFHVEWECSSADAAWEIIQVRQPDVIITDIVMRGMTGLDLVRKIREQGSDVPVVILSGYAEFEYARSAIQFGVCEYVVKPINIRSFAKLFEKLKKLLDERENEPDEQVAIEALNNNIAIRHVEEYVCNNIGGDLSLSNVADQVNLSANYLSMLFKTKTNQKYSEYVLYMRMEKAKKMLRTSDLKIYEIAQICGYNSVKNFISVFKKFAGITPMQYKNGIPLRSDDLEYPAEPRQSEHMNDSL